MNKVIETGYIASDVELKTTSDGKEVSTFTLAVKRPHSKDTTDFFRVTCWRNNAKFLTTYFQKGSGIEVVGMLVTRKWTDSQGVERYSTEIVADELDFGKASRREDSSSTAPAGNTQPPSYMPEAYKGVPQFEEITDDDELPFN